MPAAKTVCTVEVEHEGQTVEIDEVESWDYSSDVMAVGDECSFTVINHRKKYTGRLVEGAEVRLYLANRDVNGGERNLRHRGRLVRRADKVDPSTGNTIKVTSADLGWHLMNSCAPLWFNLRKGNYRELLDPTKYRPGKNGKPAYFLDPSWGLVGVRSSNDINRALKQNVRVAFNNAQKVLPTVIAVQVEPGDTPHAKMSEYAKRLNLLIGVSIDGYVQAWEPDFERAPEFQIRMLDGDDLNNVLSAQGQVDLSKVFTHVECVGDKLTYEGPEDPNNPNAGKKRGAFINPGAAPILNRNTFSDGEMYNRGLAAKAAEWAYKRAIYDHWYRTYEVADHWQYGPDGTARWWESDIMANVEDDEGGLSGNFYVSSVRCEGSRGSGDRTTVTIRLPGLLSAGIYGEGTGRLGVANPPTVKGMPRVRYSGILVSDGNTVRVTEMT